MAEIQEALANPFSRENAWLTFRTNIQEAARLREEILTSQGDDPAQVREDLLKATEALGRLTDNTILKRVVQKALEERNAE